MIHEQPSEYAGKTVLLHSGAQVIVDDWFDRVEGVSWQTCKILDCRIYGARIGFLKKEKVPVDDEVLYCKLVDGGFKHLIHVNEVKEVL